ncbi:MAG: hypothetical protein OEV49_08400 [candidate division Zixibacteria bacterium]|nr:hypothetical protein [candidate division Zixibacteria bacterium]MDH3937284.1 hypothetical protein [candidate division Zixibacteria bacterium]MDH4035313.1 hypothetical protein [candidate division Zixibacteria bacterium]
MLKKLLTISMLTALLVWAVGCSESPTETNNLTENLNLNDATGGYRATDEAPGFGDSDLMADSDESEEYDDPILLSGALDSIIEDPASGYYHLRILWGQMELDTSVTELTDWTGSLTVTRGGLAIRQVIRFERGQDAILERTDRNLIEWESFTNVHHDGIGVDIFVPPAATDSTDSATVDELVSVTFETGPYSRTFDMAELMALDTVVYLDDADSNAVAFHAFRLDKVPCARGFLAGRWGYNDEGHGIFRGFWISKKGRISGFLRGHFGVNDEGKNVFFGKWIGERGRFRGFIRGHWKQHPNHHANPNAVRHAGGRFEGEIIDANRRKIGVMGGKYKSHPQFKRGFFQGRWKLDCDEEEESRDEGL